MRRDATAVLKLAQVIEEAARPGARPPIGFNMVEYSSESARDHAGHNCQTVCCIAGWAFLLKNGRLATEGEDVFREASAFVGLPPTAAGDEVAYQLFIPLDLLPGEMKMSEIGLPQAVSMLRHFAKTGEVEWRFE